MKELVNITGKLKGAISWPLIPYERDYPTYRIWQECDEEEQSKARERDLNFLPPKIYPASASFVFNNACAFVGKPGYIFIRPWKNN